MKSFKKIKLKQKKMLKYKIKIIILNNQKIKNYKKPTNMKLFKKIRLKQ